MTQGLLTPAEGPTRCAPSSENPVRDAYATATATATAGHCVICGNELTGRADKRWCSAKCRQRAWRQAKAAPAAPVAAPRCDTIYACPVCETRYIGEQRCPECNLWCRRVGPGGPCPHCDEPVAVQDIVPTAPVAAPSGRRPKGGTNARGDQAERRY
jgi:hypothetical protein